LKESRREFIKNLLEGSLATVFGALVACLKSPTKTEQSERIENPTKTVYHYTPCYWDKFLEDVNSMTEGEAKDWISKIVQRVFMHDQEKVSAGIKRTVYDNYGFSSGTYTDTINAMSEQKAKNFIIDMVGCVFTENTFKHCEKYYKALCGSWRTCAGFPFSCPNCVPA